MNKYQIGQKLIYTPTPVLDNPYPDSEECTYVGLTTQGQHVVRLEEDGFLEVARDSELTVPTKIVPLWEALTKQLETYGWSWEDDYDRRKTAKDWFYSLKELGVDIPVYIEVDDV